MPSFNGNQRLIFTERNLSGTVTRSRSVMEQQNKKCEKSSSNGILRKQQRMSSIFRQIFLSVLLVKKYRQTPL